MLSDDIQFIKGVGAKKAEALLTETGIKTVEDLLYYKPKRYIDRSSLFAIIDLEPDQKATLTVTIEKSEIVRAKKTFLRLIVSDETSSMNLIFFAGISFFSKIFKNGMLLSVSGKVLYSSGKFSMVHPEYDIIYDDEDKQSLNTARIVPVYPLTQTLKENGITSRSLRRIISTALDSYFDKIHETLPVHIIQKFSFMSLADSLKQIHFPDSFEYLAKARERIVFNELLLFQIYILLNRKINEKEILSESFTNTDISHFLANLPFSLTDDQLSAIKDISKGLESFSPMNRLIQGDVGSGKTAVAAAAVYLAHINAYQSALMAPTEILAKQLYENLKKLTNGEIPLILSTSSCGKKERSSIEESLSNNEVSCAVGTHSLLEDYVRFKNLRLVIIDEQHRFGVNQRSKLRSKGKIIPHLISMTATPIPRSLALTLYGDFDVSVIKSKPANRGKIKTISFPETKINSVYNSVRKYAAEGRQIYIVLPLIEDNDKTELASATGIYEDLKTRFSEFNVAILHGKMKSVEKNEVMDKFKSGETQILVSTTVIEIGVDVANANVMIIYHAERFGLAQLHQLRGRIGRGKFDSFCVLIHPEKISETAKERISIMENCSDGFEISEMDLKLRGHGELIGNKQSGFLSGFEFFDISSDIDILKNAREFAEETISEIKAENSIDIEKFFSNAGKKGMRMKIIQRITSDVYS